MACRALEAAAGRQVVDVEASADRAHGRALRLRPPQAAEPSICRILTFGLDRLQREGACSRREQEVLSHDASPHGACSSYVLLWRLPRWMNIGT